MIEGHLDKMWWRIHNLTRRITVKTVDDSKPYQVHQTEGFKDELRDGVPRYQEFGFSSVPLVGAQGLTVATHAGYQGSAAITNTNDIRYRVKDQKPGENSVYMVDGATAKTGDGGTVRTILKGAIGWATSLFGKTITIGDKDVTTVSIATSASGAVTITIGASSNCTVNLKGSAGDVVIAGVSLRNHLHSNSGGTGNSGPPVAT